MKRILNLILRKKEVKQAVPVDTIVYNVENFNLWFVHKNNGAVYANEGIYLRLDKLSQAHIEDYLLKSYGIVKADSQRIFDFEQEIRKNWSRVAKSKHESVYGC